MNTVMNPFLTAQAAAAVMACSHASPQALAQLRQRHLILRGHIGYGTIELAVIDALSTLTRVRDLGALVYQQIEQLAAQFGFRRQGRLGAHRVFPHARQTLLHFERSDQFLVHHGEDEVAAARGGIRRSNARRLGRNR